MMANRVSFGINWTPLVLLLEWQLANDFTCQLPNPLTPQLGSALTSWQLPNDLTSQLADLLMCQLHGFTSWHRSALTSWQLPNDLTSQLADLLTCRLRGFTSWRRIWYANCPISWPCSLALLGPVDLLFDMPTFTLQFDILVGWPPDVPVAWFH